jgi:hypothetical protein
VLKGVADGVVVDLDVGPMGGDEAIGGSAKRVEGFSEFGEALLESGALFDIDFDAGRRNRADFIGQVVSGAIGTKGDENEDEKKHLAHGRMKPRGGRTDK